MGELHTRRRRFRVPPVAQLVVIGFIVVAIGLGLMAIMIPKIVAEGGMWFDNDGRKTWLPVWQGVLMTIGFAGAILAGGGYCLYAGFRPEGWDNYEDDFGPAPDEQVAVFPEQVYRYPMPWQSYFAAIVLSAFGLVFIGPRDVLSEPFFIVIFLGLPGLLVVATTIASRLAKVILGGHTVAIYNGLGQVVFSSPWRAIRGVVLELHSTRNRSDGMLVFARHDTYRIDGEYSSGRFGSHIIGFVSFMKDIQRRVPPSADLDAPVYRWS